MSDGDPGVESPRSPAAQAGQPERALRRPRTYYGVAPDAHRGNISLGKIIGFLSPLVLISGIVIYGIQSLGYEWFYGRLGIDPAAIGLSYTTVLSRSAGFVAVIILAAVLSLIGDWWQGESPLLWIGPTIAGLLLIFLVLELFGSTRAANAVTAGRPVAPLRNLGVTELAFRADPVRIEPAGKAGEASAIDRLVSRADLLYLGQANGVVVLYDASTQSALYLPSASIVMIQSNCATKRSPDPNCKTRFRLHFWPF
jgi:hypothetical protein